MKKIQQHKIEFNEPLGDIFLHDCYESRADIWEGVKCSRRIGTKLIYDTPKA